MGLDHFSDIEMKELIDADMVHQRLAKEQIVKHKRQTKLGTTIERVWVSGKGGRGEVREADDEEEKRARARVLPRQLPPRIKRTM